MTETNRSRPGALIGVAFSGVLLGAVLGAFANAVNGWVCVGGRLDLGHPVWRTGFGYRRLRSVPGKVAAPSGRRPQSDMTAVIRTTRRPAIARAAAGEPTLRLQTYRPRSRCPWSRTAGWLPTPSIKGKRQYTTSLGNWIGGSSTARSTTAAIPRPSTPVTFRASVALPIQSLVGMISRIELFASDSRICIGGDPGVVVAPVE
jgi:hypothetical protein